MRSAPRILFVVFLLASAQPMLHAASFDCAHAKSAREKLVCSNPALSEADSKLAAAYAKIREEISPESFALVQADQREWLGWLDHVCPLKNSRGDDPKSCLADRYDTRLRQLTTGRATIDDMHFYPRAHFVFVAAKQKPDDSEIDPGYGYGEFSWPQIDKPTLAQEAWNNAVFATTLKDSCCVVDTHPVTSLDRAVDSNDSVYGFYNLAAANQNFIEVNVGNSTYGWGAAHPNTYVISFGWWLDAGRPLQTSDVFAAGSNWQQKLAAITLAKLRVNPGPDALWRPSKYIAADELQEGVDKGVVDLGSWNLSSAGLTITFGQYAVGPYASGMPSATISWSELAPLLAPTLQPAALPPAIPRQQ